ncbi:MAG: CBS domain-containing protein [Bacteriovoracaceae bacterium]|jgi:CBS domain-containing protein
MSLMDDQIEEEQEIADEQDERGTSLSADSFKKQISCIKSPSVISLDEETSLGDTVKLMQEKKIGSVVLTRNTELSGIITERDLLMKVLGLKEDWKNLKAKDIMTENPQSLQSGDELAYVLNNMHVGGYRHVPIVDEANTPVSMISIKDVVSWVLDHFPQEITNLTGEPFRGKSDREGA